MNLKEVVNSIEHKYSSLSDACIAELLGAINVRSFNKNEVIVREGQHAKKVYYVIQGTARAYYYTNDKDVSDWFAFENEFICPIVSFFSDGPSPHNIQVLQDSILAELSQEAVRRLSQHYRDFDKLIQGILVETILRQQKRISSILFYTSDERYEQLLGQYPDIIDHVPLKHIASHLGMTVETLSRVRKSSN